MPAPRITVQMLAQVVDSDGTPVNRHGEPHGRGWRRCVEFIKCRVSVNRFCPKNVAAGLRVVFYEQFPRDPQPVHCSCHDKWRLVKGIIMLGEEL